MRAYAHPSAIGQHGLDITPVFADRNDAGTRLAERLTGYRGRNPVVLGIPRGGVPVAAAVATALDAELDVVVARKLGSPISSELAIGAVTADGGRYLNDAIIRELAVSDAYVAQETKAQTAEAVRRQQRFRAGAAAPSLGGRPVILVDDGLATGATMIAAARAVRAAGPSRLIVAVPVGSGDACAALRREADEVICLATPEPFLAVGAYYRNFEQTEDAEVALLLRQARSGARSARASAT
jgi:predicted phosphoribosyltransferase